MTLRASSEVAASPRLRRGGGFALIALVVIGFAVNAGVRQLSARGGAFLESLGKIDVLAVNRPEADALVPALVAAGAAAQAEE